MSPPIPFAEKGIWIFVGIDLVIFALFFLVFLMERAAAPALFSASQDRLSPGYGFANTLLLVTSSWLLVRSLGCMSSNVSRARYFLSGTILFGGVFVLSKGLEYGDKIRQGISIVENTFFTFYYLLTFIHLLHVLAGLIALKAVHGWLGRGSNRKIYDFSQSLGIYWHMVDLLWIYLFLVLYLIR